MIRSSHTCQSLIDRMPKNRNRLSVSVKKIFEKAYLIYSRRIGVSFAIISNFRNPILGFKRINNIEEIRRI